MVRNVCCANLVVQEVNESKGIEFVVRTIDCVQCTLHERVVVVGKVWYVDVRVLEPMILHDIVLL